MTMDFPWTTTGSGKTGKLIHQYMATTNVTSENRAVMKVPITAYTAGLMRLCISDFLFSFTELLH